MHYDATTTLIFGEVPPYYFFTGIGFVFAASIFILLLLRYDYDLQRYTRIFLLSAISLLIGGKIFGYLAAIYGAVGANTPITVATFHYDGMGLVFYGGMLGFLFTFVLLCKMFDKKVNYNIVDLAVISVPLFHIWGRLSCFFAGCCFGAETTSSFSILYTTYIDDEIVTASRIPIQLVEVGFNVAIAFCLIKLLNYPQFRGRLLFVYLGAYAVVRSTLEFFRADMERGLWAGISFSQFVSIVVLTGLAATYIILKKSQKNAHETA